MQLAFSFENKEGKKTLYEAGMQGTGTPQFEEVDASLLTYWVPTFQNNTPNGRSQEGSNR